MRELKEKKYIIIKIHATYRFWYFSAAYKTCYWHLMCKYVQLIFFPTISILQLQHFGIGLMLRVFRGENPKNYKHLFLKKKRLFKIEFRSPFEKKLIFFFFYN